MVGTAQANRAGRDTSGGPSGSYRGHGDQPVCRDPGGSDVAQGGNNSGQQVNTRDAGDIERAVTAFARSPNGGLVVTSGAPAQRHRNLIVTLAARHKLPAVYPESAPVAAGGLVSSGADYIDQYRRAASYVDRILKGEKPADLPVEAPTRYTTVINLKTAKALGLAVPDKLLALADEVIER